MLEMLPLWLELNEGSKEPWSLYLGLAMASVGLPLKQTLRRALGDFLGGARN